MGLGFLGGFQVTWGLGFRVSGFGNQGVGMA